MHALSIKFNKIHLSMNYDGLTIYPQFTVGGDYKLALVKCINTGIFVPAVKYEPLTKEGEALNVGCRKIKTDDNYSFNRFIHRDDDDHIFYHRDNFSQNDDHSHFKFKHMLSQKLCNDMLDIFIENKIVTAEEKIAFMRQLAARYDLAKIQLRDQLTGDKAKDLAAITRFVKNCGDNDILAHIHEYLKGDEFAYLQRPIDSKWQSIDANHNLEMTSGEWAMIEKGIALQMAKNIEVNTNYTRNVASERAEQLESDQPFFNIKRKTLSGNTSKMFQEFRDHNTNAFDQSYEKHMSRFTR